ncbi:MAG: transposon-transfer assisting family protein [Clostridia bacterium]
MKNASFTLAETNLMVIYNIGTRLNLMAELGNMLGYVSEDETELRGMTISVIQKLNRMTDKDFVALNLTPDSLKGR